MVAERNAGATAAGFSLLFDSCVNILDRRSFARSFDFLLNAEAVEVALVDGLGTCKNGAQPRR